MDLSLLTTLEEALDCNLASWCHLELEVVILYYSSIVLLDGQLSGCLFELGKQASVVPLLQLHADLGLVAGVSRLENLLHEVLVVQCPISRQTAIFRPWGLLRHALIRNQLLISLQAFHLMLIFRYIKALIDEPLPCLLVFSAVDMLRPGCRLILHQRLMDLLNCAASTPEPEIRHLGMR